MTDDDLDFRFSWRWLAPDSRSSKIEYFGLSNGEIAWWERIANQVSAPILSTDTRGCLISLNEQVLEELKNSSSIDASSWICAWGKGKYIDNLLESIGGDNHIRQYALLPAKSPRLAVPMCSSECVLGGLALHRPGRLLARLALSLARIFIRVGVYWPIRQKILVVVTKNTHKQPVGVITSDLKLNASYKDFALYLGSVSSNRKTVVLPLPLSACPTVIKSAESKLGQGSLEAESRALNDLASTSVSENIPKRVNVIRSGNTFSLIQEYRPRIWASDNRIRKEAVRFIASLIRTDIKLVKLSSYLRSISQLDPLYTDRDLDIVITNIQYHFGVFESRNKQIYLCRNHNDFAPWNCAWTKKGFFVFDWETSSANGLALSDAFYFVLSSYVHVSGNRSCKFILEELLNFSNKIVEKAELNICESDIKIYLALWLLENVGHSSLYRELLVFLSEKWV